MKKWILVQAGLSYVALILILLVFIAGCVNFSQVSVVEEGCFPDGTCTVVGSYMNGGVIGGKQIVVVSVKDCVKDADEKWTCTVGQKTVSIDDGMVEKMLRATVGITRHSGKAYTEGDEGDNINSGSAAGAASSSKAGSYSSSSASSKSKAEGGDGGGRGGRGGH